MRKEEPSSASFSLLPQENLGQAAFAAAAAPVAVTMCDYQLQCFLLHRVVTTCSYGKERRAQQARGVVSSS